MIRVAFDIHTIGQRATGNETYAEGLLHAFETERHNDIEFYFYHSNNIEKPEWNGHFRRLWPHFPYLRIPVVTPYFLAKDRIDVAHFQYISPPITSCATILTVHDLSYERHPEFFSPAMSTRMRLLMPFLTKKATHIITVSEATRQDLVNLYNIAPERISVIYNGAPQGFHIIEDTTLLKLATARFGVDQPFILCVGNLGTRKNQQRLVRAFSRLVKNNSIDHDLVLVGKETYAAKEIMNEIYKQGISSRVHVTGFVTQEELVALYNLASFSIYPSLFEGFGLPILESMACGTPVITSSISCMPEVAGDAAFLIDPQDDDAILDAMEQLLGNPVLHARLRQAGLERHKQFSWSEAARRTLNVYRLAAQK